jgi:hypothetical protein
MLRLSLRSSRTGRLLARVVEQEGNLFVLDFGDPRVIADATQRITHGFTVWRMGRLVTAAPSDPLFLTYLAEFYASEGMLVAVEEPNWPGRVEEEADLGEDLPTEVVPR